MSNIDFSRLLTSEDLAEQAVQAHRAAVKAVCKQRILARYPLEAQQNIVQAIAVHVLEVRVGNAAQLDSEDIALALAAQEWVADMQAACRVLAADLSADPLEEGGWPDLPEGVAGLIARF